MSVFDLLISEPFPAPDHLQQPVKLPGISEKASVATVQLPRKGDVSPKLARTVRDPGNAERELATRGRDTTFPVGASHPAQVAEVGTPATAQPTAGGGEQLLPVPVLAENTPHCQLKQCCSISGEARHSIQGSDPSVVAGDPYELQATPSRNETPAEKGQANAATIPSNGMQALREQPKGIPEQQSSMSKIPSKVEAENGCLQGKDQEAGQVRDMRERGEAGSPSPGLHKATGSNLVMPDLPQPSALSITLDQVVAFLRRYIVFPMPEQFDLVALWIAHTWVYDLFHWTPYLIVRSPEPECGKSTVLASIKLLARAAWKVVVPTPAVIYRKIEAHRPTVIIDEYDTIYSEKIKSEANETLRGTLNAGFERGDVIPRCDGPKNELLEFSPYCPKALAGIGRLPETVESRAFIIPIVRLGHNEHVQEYDEETAPEEARPIHQALQTWADSAQLALKGANPPRPSELKPRQRNIAKPLLAIADLAGGEWPDRARDAIVRICAKEKFISQAAQLLADVRSIMLAGSLDKITTDLLLEYLVRVESANSPWPVLWENDLKNGKTRGPAKKLATMLANYDIHPRTLRFGGDVKKGYARADFADAWDRYLEPAKSETAELDLDL